MEFASLCVEVDDCTLSGVGKGASGILHRDTASSIISDTPGANFSVSILLGESGSKFCHARLIGKSHWRRQPNEANAVPPLVVLSRPELSH